MSYTPRIGMEVVCIKKGPWALAPGAFDTGARDIFPLHGQVLTIRTIEYWQGACFLRFAEIINPVVEGIEGSFSAIHFRPAVKRVTDISTFTQMLNPSKVSA